MFRCISSEFSILKVFICALIEVFLVFQIHREALIHYPDVTHQHGLITSILGMQLILDAHHFHDGAMRVKCVASLSPVLWKGGKESVVQRRPPTYENREAMLLGNYYIIMYLFYS